MAVDEQGIPACPICDGTTFEEVEVPETLRCAYCKREKKLEEILRIWNKPPFFNAEEGTYYDGCRGWD